ncbi:unnamed protein product [Tilletia laevis]|uniref:RNA polymerase II assembly factor Rtp1 C-terminal domain-containing protein n=2 Tax=Tilletia TaxID=13289 RepID=A0A177VIC2_9BASI|nr:hypothetical protein CF336_g1018 [Tilletia laevis]KAE8264034.1 hypothetical protein A4X03_0g1242 [Tilletia caries]KAE8208075.1 hypothetical protein CF335_g678 [Tilletia laevis]CAD6887135.1 unnamed protein product [Tilletia caries]CAD6902951.1 unnamed protein product [Tilletia caries]
MTATERGGNVLAAVRILIGEDDVKLERSTDTNTDSDSSSATAAHDLLEQRLRQRLQRARTACARLRVEDPHSEDDASPAQDATGAAALRLLVCMHESEMETETETAAAGASAPSKSPLDPALAQPLRKLISLISRWSLAPALSRFDSMYARAHPPPPANQAQSRFTEVVDDERRLSEKKENRPVKSPGQEDLAVDGLSTILRSLRTILPEEGQDGQASSGPPQRLSISTQTARIMLELCSSEILDVALRITRASSPARSHDAQSASRFVNLVLRSLATQSALSTLAGVGRFKTPPFETKTSPSTHQRAPTPTFVLQTVKRMSALQLLRPDGVEALLRSSLEEAESQPELAQKIASYQNMAALSVAMTEAPVGVPAELFVKAVLKQMMDFLQANAASPGSSISPQLTVVVLALARLSRKHPSHLQQSLDERIYQCFFGPAVGGSRCVEDDVVVASQDVRLAAKMLVCIVEHAEPSSDFLHFLLDPILGPCFALLDQLSRSITSLSAKTDSSGKGKVRVIGDMRDGDDLAIRQELRGAMKTCLGALARSSPADELVEAFGPKAQSLLDRVAGGQLFSGPNSTSDALPKSSLTWANDDGGVCLKVGRNHSDALHSVLEGLPAALASSISLSEVADLKLPSDLAFSLPVQAATIVTVLKDAQRADVAKLLLQAVLDRYVAVRSGVRLEQGDSNGGDGAGLDMRPILYLQMIMQLFETFGEALLKGDTRSILAFIDFTLPSTVDIGRTAAPRPVASEEGASQGLQGLLNVNQHPIQQPVRERGGDALEEEFDPDAVVTALNLLLATLEGDSGLSTETTPLLGVIQAKIAALLSSSNEEIRRLTQEAMLVLKARAASRSSNRLDTKSPGTTIVTPRSKGLAMYQEALKLLQDPILPVRAHGLIILRELVSESEKRPSRTSAAKKGTLIVDSEDAATGQGDDEDIRPEVDEALLPAILDIFVQAIQDEESYLYLNAIQGLAAMAISGGTHVLRVLVGKYTGADERAGRNAKQAEVDRRLRIGEALLRVIQRCGAGLGPNVSIVVEPLVTMLRNAHEPTALRSSAISLLGTCVEAAPLEMAAGRHSISLALTCLDIISIESTERSQPLFAARRRKRKDRARTTGSIVVTGSLANIVDEEESDEEDEQPRPDSALATDTRLPQLRRSALFLLTLLISGTNAVLEKYMEDRTEGARSDLLGSITGDGGGITTLRLPGGSVLQPLPSLTDGPTTQQQQRSRPALPPLLYEPKLLGRTKTVLGFVAGRDADAVVRVQAGEAQRECSQMELHLVHLLAASSAK